MSMRECPSFDILTCKSNIKALVEKRCERNSLGSGKVNISLSCNALSSLVVDLFDHGMYIEVVRDVGYSFSDFLDYIDVETCIAQLTEFRIVYKTI